MAPFWLFCPAAGGGLGLRPGIFGVAHSSVPINRPHRAQQRALMAAQQKNPRFDRQSRKEWGQRNGDAIFLFLGLPQRAKGAEPQTNQQQFAHLGIVPSCQSGNVPAAPEVPAPYANAAIKCHSLCSGGRVGDNLRPGKLHF